MTASAFVRRASVLLVALASVLAISSACGVGDLSLVGKNCPCATDQGFVCDTSTNKCVQSGVTFDAGPTCDDAGCACTTDADCGDPGAPKCVNGQCAACATNPDSCPVDTYCLNGQTCSPGCKNDADCTAISAAAKQCDTTRHQCVQCKQQSDCPGDLQCSPSGLCAQKCDADAANSCTGGQSCCGGLCIDTTSDINNCNGCGITCSGADTLCCGGTCTDPLVTTQHCGTCANACSTANGTPSCSGGNCVFACNPGYGHCAGDTGCDTANLNSLHQCGSACVDCTTAILHASGAACSGNGGTSCDYSTCNSSYLDVDGNRANGCETHCGGPNQICCPGNICSFGTCQTNNRCPDD